MKKLLLIICLIATFAISANAQFHIELGMNGNSPQGDFEESYDLGIGFYFEPKYAISEKFDLGLLIGRNGFVGADFDGGGFGGLGILTILPTGTYRFTENNVTPYVGAGLGMYFIEGAEITTGNTTVEGDSESKFGFAPRAGVYIGRLNLGAAYNVVKDVNFIQFNLGIRILSRD